VISDLGADMVASSSLQNRRAHEAEDEVVGDGFRVSVLQSLDALILSPERGNGWVLDFVTSFPAAFLDSTLVNSHITLRS